MSFRAFQFSDTSVDTLDCEVFIWRMVSRVYRLEMGAMSWMEVPNAVNVPHQPPRAPYIVSPMQNITFRQVLQMGSVCNPSHALLSTQLVDPSVPVGPGYVKTCKQYCFKHNPSVWFRRYRTSWAEKKQKYKILATYSLLHPRNDEKMS